MLISYPILPANAANQSEQEKFDAMVRLTQTDRGLYPVTTGNRWHGGIHLTPGTEPIRAIADGVVVAYRLAPATKDYPGQGLYDTSFVLIKHDTHSGENTQVVYYSLYMHLAPKGSLTDAQRSQLMPFLRDAATGDAATQAPANTRVWRKEVLGFGGQLYGVPTVHFEIFTTETDLARFWRDASAVAAGGHGSDDVFGDIHLVLPANLNFAARHPHAIAPHQIDLPGRNHFYVLPVGTAGQNADRLHVKVQLRDGRRIATTYRLDAQGKIAAQVGQPIDQGDYEHELYRLAAALYADCPSAGFEYLRFGRILNGDTTTHTENWQLIRYSEDAIGYIDLAEAAHNVSVLSDADFPMYWQKLEEGQTASPTDGIANVDNLTQLLNLPASPSEPSLSAPPSFVSRAADPAVSNQLRHFVCKHPSEWDASDLETRYAALRQPGQALTDATAWQNFKDHVDAMAFWPQSGIADRSVWHFHPISFISHYRKCSWLSADEMTQLLPMQGLNISFQRGRTLLTQGQNTARQLLPAGMQVALNKARRKYSIESALRTGQFWGQIVQETDGLQTVREYADGSAYEGRADLGNTQPGDGRRFRGRGVIQVTGRVNYTRYQTYRNRNFTTDANALLLQSDAYAACDSSGFYWTAEETRDRRLNPPGSRRRYQWNLDGLTNINRRADTRTFQNVTQDAPVETDVLNVTLQVNRAALHLDNRVRYFKYAFKLLSDDTTSQLPGGNLRP